MANVRFVDQLKVGAYSSTGDGVTIANNIDNYVLTATGQVGLINGEAQLQFDGINLAIGGTAGTSRLEVRDTTDSDLLLIKNATTDQGIKVNSAGVLQLLEFATLPTAVAGGFIYGEDEFWIGVSS